MSEPSNPDSCGSCRWWQAMANTEASRTYGLCRRHAPMPYLVIDTVTDAEDSELEDAIERPDAAIWPETDPNDWCGEHLPRRRTA